MFSTRIRKNKIKRRIAKKLKADKHKICFIHINADFLQHHNKHITHLLHNMNQQLATYTNHQLRLFNFAELEIEMNLLLEATLEPLLMYEQNDLEKYEETNKKANQISRCIKNLQQTKEQILAYFQKLTLPIDFIPENPKAIDWFNIYYVVLKHTSPQRFFIHFDNQNSNITKVIETSLKLEADEMNHS